ncbi:hypothetical protein EMIT0P294_10216 [Pseudomonas sp. IT-P294]
MCILYMADPADAQKWRDCLSTLAPRLEFRQWPDIGNPAEVHYILAWEPLGSLVQQFGNLRLLYAAGAGVDQFDLARWPAHVSLIRLVDSSMADIMAARRGTACEGRPYADLRVVCWAVSKRDHNLRFRSDASCGR